MKWTDPKVGDLVTCETVAAIVLHVRRVVDRGFRPSGHVSPKPLALCGSPVDWDTKQPAESTSCRSCKNALAKVSP